LKKPKENFLNKKNFKSKPGIARRPYRGFDDYYKMLEYLKFSIIKQSQRILTKTR